VPGLLKAFPILSSGVLPDFIDDEGVPLLEPDSPGHRWHRARIGYVPCTLNDARGQLGLPMNLPTLKAVVASPEKWRRGVKHVVGLFPMKHLTTLERMRAVSNAFHCLPYILDARAGEPIPQDIANLFKFFRGIAHYAARRTLVGNCDQEHGQTMYEYVMARGLTVSETGVCPASKALMDRIEDEVGLLTLGEGDADWTEVAYTRADLEAARRLGSHFDHFAVLCAVLYVHRKRGLYTSESRSQAELLAQFPLPFVGLLAARSGDPRSKMFFAGMRSTMRTLVPLTGITADAERLVDGSELGESHDVAAQQRAIELCWQLNLGAAKLLRRRVDSNADSFAEILIRLIDARVAAGTEDAASRDCKTTDPTRLP
jgi:hypothetical protein